MTLYELANQVFINVLKSSHKTCVLASYQDENVILTEQDGKYVVVFDPLDVSKY